MAKDVGGVPLHDGHDDGVDGVQAARIAKDEIGEACTLDHGIIRGGLVDV